MEGKKQNKKNFQSIAKNIEEGTHKDLIVFQNSNFIVACSSPKEGQHIAFMANFLKVSMFAFFDQQQLKGHATHPSNEQNYNFQKMSNLLLSCIQELGYLGKQNHQNFCQNIHENASCSFVLAYRLRGFIYCVKTVGFEVYLLEQDRNQLRPLCSSTTVSYSKTALISQLKAPLHDKMGKVKCQYLLGRIEHKNEGSEIGIFENVKMEEGNWRILIGCSQTFGFISPGFILKSIKGHQKEKKMGINEKIKLILQQGRKKMRTLHKQNLYLFSWQP